MLMVTTKGKNALKIMLYLSQNQKDEYVKLKDIAKKEGISEKYLEQIVSYLQKAGKVKSSRGANGGYRLARTPQEYTVGEILKCLEGDMSPADCVRDGENVCQKRSECLCYPLWGRLDHAIHDVLDHTTLQDLIDEKVKDRS